MERLAETLQSLYNSFIAHEAPKNFFNGLSDYTKYALENSFLKDAINKELEKKHDGYKKIDELEKQSIKELNEAKEKLLKVIETRKIDADTIFQGTSFIPTSFFGEQENILVRLDKFEKGIVTISGYYSSNLSNFLFDLAAGIKAKGYESDIGEYLVSNKEYGDYYAEINGEGGGPYGGNVYGNFVFSKSLPSRYKQVRKVERERRMEPWGAFDLLVKSEIGRDAALKDINSFEDLAKHLESYTEHEFNDDDSLDVLYAIQDWKNLSTGKFEFATNRPNDGKLRFLDVGEFKIAAIKVHGKLNQVIPPANEEARQKRESMTQALNAAMEESRIVSIEERLQKVERLLEELLAARKEDDVKEQEEIGKHWGPQDRPVYDLKSGKLSLGKLSLIIPEDAKQERQICKAVFSKMIGRWAQQYETDIPENTFYHAVCRVNTRAKNELHVIGLLVPQMKRTRINKELFEVDSNEM